MNVDSGIKLVILQLQGGLQVLTTLSEVVERKKTLCKERDLTAELYNLWITKMHDHQDNEVKYNQYADMIQNLEPYSNMVKEEIRECNRLICEFEGVDAIADTDYTEECTYRFGYARPND